MNHSVRRSIAGFSLGLLAATAAACSSTAADNGGTANGNGGGGGNSKSDGTCAKNSLKLLFSPMYSAFDGQHTFKVPVVVNGVDPGDVSFTASDSSMVDIGQPDPDTGIAMITVRKAGTVTIVGSAGSLCGTSLLTITQSSPEDWQAGSARYNNGIVPPPRGQGPTDAGSRKELACTNCHGDSATMMRYRTVAHTPQQTGGFSDDELQNLFRHGMIPKGKESYFDFGAVGITQSEWSMFHQWDATDDEAKGIITYLRALTPTPQTGTRGEFGGGFMRPDGGNRMRGDGGRPDRMPPPDADATEVDAGAPEIDAAQSATD
jgi:hypothetical protein